MTTTFYRKWQDMPERVWRWPNFTPAEIEYLKSQRLTRIATVHPNGSIQNNPVVYWYNAKDDTIDIGDGAFGVAICGGGVVIAGAMPALRDRSADTHVRCPAARVSRRCLRRSLNCRAPELNPIGRRGQTLPAGPRVGKPALRSRSAGRRDWTRPARRPGPASGRGAGRGCGPESGCARGAGHAADR